VKRIHGAVESVLLKPSPGNAWRREIEKNLQCALVICKVWKLAIVLELFVVTTCK
jgi:hypothetical protein